MGVIFGGKSILITGGTGSFGKKLTQYILDNHSPKRLIIFSRDELKQFEMRRSDERLRFFIGDVRDKERLLRAFDNVDIVIHAAALKQVPACEYNPFEAIKTNIIGAQNIIEAAIDTGVKKVLALSTDKAVSPVNLYGATKLCAEKLFVNGNSYASGKDTRFSVVRYGNVVGSRGSVIPLFLRQARDYQKLTITDERMTRFWITLGQAVQFVITSLDRMRGGEIFIPKIPSMRVIDLAKAICPNYEVTGIRPGEKLHEELISEHESRHAIELPDRYIIQPLHPWFERGQAEGGVMQQKNYASDNNTEWLTGEELKMLIKGGC